MDLQGFEFVRMPWERHICFSSSPFCVAETSLPSADSARVRGHRERISRRCPLTARPGWGHWAQLKPTLRSMEKYTIHDLHYGQKGTMWGTTCLQVPRSSNIKMSFPVTCFPRHWPKDAHCTGGNGLGQETSWRWRLYQERSRWASSVSGQLPFQMGSPKSRGGNCFPSASSSSKWALLLWTTGVTEVLMLALCIQIEQILLTGTTLRLLSTTAMAGLT